MFKGCSQIMIYKIVQLVLILYAPFKVQNNLSHLRKRLGIINIYYIKKIIIDNIIVKFNNSQNFLEVKGNEIS